MVFNNFFCKSPSLRQLQIYCPDKLKETDEVSRNPSLRVVNRPFQTLFSTLNLFFHLSGLPRVEVVERPSRVEGFEGSNTLQNVTDSLPRRSRLGC